jgi:hypothetical protein
MPREAEKYWRRVIAVLTVVFLTAMTSFIQAAGNPNPGVLPPESRPHGATYGEWGARWWQWALSIPAAVNPVLDTTGQFCGVGQTGQVWFLAGTFGGDATRTCTVSPERMLFFPFLNQVCSTVLGDGTTEAELRACANGFVDAILASPLTILTVTIDGQPVQALETYRAQSPPGTFDITFPPGAVFGIPEGPSASVSDGLWLMLAPLSPGNHLISFGAVTPTFSFAVTYNLTVQ